MPRPQAAAAILFQQAVELSPVFGCPTTGRFIGKELQEKPKGLGGGGFIAKKGGDLSRKVAFGGGGFIALGGGDLSWKR